MTTPNAYCRRQNGALHYAVYLVALVFVALGVAYRAVPFVAALFAGPGVFLALAALCFHHLTVCDEGSYLAARFGPLPLLRTRIPYDRITAVEADRLSILDGIGLHYVPWRGWAINIRGGDCVRVSLGKRTIRIGTDDADGLIAFLRAKTGGGGASPQGRPRRRAASPRCAQ